jgi:hypothetical protein
MVRAARAVQMLHAAGAGDGGRHGPSAGFR